MRILMYSLVFILMVTLPVWGGEDFKKVETWNHGEQILGRIWSSAIDKDGNVIGRFYKCGGRLITPKEIVSFAQYGEGPDDLKDSITIFDYKGDLAILELESNAKVFKRKGNTYVWKDTLWFQRPKFPHLVSDVRYVNGKWFFSGEGNLIYDRILSKCYNLKVYNEERQAIKELLHFQYEGNNANFMKTQHLLDYQNQVFLIPEDRLAVTIISINDLTVKREVQLEVPSWYKKMGPDFYTYKEYRNDPDGLIKDWEYWLANYSRISKTGIDGNHIVLQMRTCNDKLKKFCLLIYNADTFKLEKQFFSDDYFLGVRNKRYYFYQSGDPGVEEIDQCVILVYQWDVTK